MPDLTAGCCALTTALASLGFSDFRSALRSCQLGYFSFVAFSGRQFFLRVNNSLMDLVNASLISAVLISFSQLSEYLLLPSKPRSSQAFYKCSDLALVALILK